TRRRLGPEAATRLVASYVSGVWAGDADRLSAQSSFPKLTAFEKNHGSIFLGFIKSMKQNKGLKKKAPKGLLSFTEGLESLPRALARKLGEKLRLQVNISQLTPPASSNDSWTVDSNSGRFRTRGLILAESAPGAAQLIENFAPQTAQALRQIPYVPLISAACTVPKGSTRIPLDGFGFLVAPGAEARILGCLWNSSLFKNRCPENKDLLTVFMGGATQPGLTSLIEQKLLMIIKEDLRRILGLRGDPAFVHIERYGASIPQYNIGHEKIKESIRMAETTFPGLRFAGNYREGISVGDVVKYSKKLMEGEGVIPKVLPRQNQIAQRLNESGMRV
ncbi:MAG: protoporphyrinogen oxidase, partial [Elusimicrobia bacterium]|nr:protoporphyrinogen oxidase [Candidatus Obscuribacterium magneticum]